MKFLPVIVWGIALNLPSSQTVNLSLDVMWFEVVALGAKEAFLRCLWGKKVFFYDRTRGRD